MDNMNRELSAIEQELQALAAQGRVPRADDAALLERLVQRADALCAAPRSARPWYRSPAWRCAAALVLLAVPGTLWWFASSPQAASPSGILTKQASRAIAVQELPTPCAAEPTALAGEMVCGLPECAPEHAPAVAAIDLLDEPVSESAIAVATYSGGTNAAHPMPQHVTLQTPAAGICLAAEDTEEEEEEDAEDSWAQPNAMAVNAPMDRALPSRKIAKPSLCKRKMMAPPAKNMFFPLWHKLKQHAEEWTK